jgi:hypothetical protein
LTTTQPIPGASASVTFIFDRAELRPDELYAGLVQANGGAYHLILLAGEARGVTWQQAKVFAAVLGGQLPSLLEQAILHQNVRGEFPADGAYWLSDAYNNRNAFYYDVSGPGSCDYESIDAGLRTRAVRRIYVGGAR